MRIGDALDLMERAIMALGLSGITPSAIARPNVAFDAGNLELYFETFVSHFKVERDTERGSIARCVGGIVVCCPMGEGLARSDAIVDALLDLFSPRSPTRFDGYARTARIFGSAAQGSTRVYALGAERSDGRAVDGRYKTTVTVTLEIWED